MNNPISQQDLCEYAFCQGGISSHKNSLNKRPLLVFTALAVLTLQFRRGPARLISVQQSREFQENLREAGIKAIEAANIASSETRDMARLAAELFRDNFETRAPHVYFDRRFAPAPELWDSKRLWRENQVEFLTYVTRVQRQILERGGRILRPVR